MKKNLFGFLSIIFAVILFLCGQSVVHANEDKDQEVKLKTTRQTVTGRVFYDTANLYTLRGTKNGAAWSDVTASLAVQYPDGHNEMVFCVAPGVPLVGGMWTDGYEGIESSAVDRDALIAACIWQNVFPNKTQHEEIATRAVVWSYLKAYNLNITSIDQIPEFPQLKQTLMDAVENYKKTPSFDKTTVQLEYGKTKNLSSGGVDLRAYDNVVSNDSNVRFEIAADGLSVNVTPTDPNKATGTYAAMKSYAHGTPIIWTKANSQTVVTPRIADPASYSVKWDIKTTGDIEIAKKDKNENIYLPNTDFKIEFSGTNAPAAKTVTTGSNGKVTVKGIPNGVKYKVTEIGVPKPYVLASAIGESDTYEGTVKANETAIVTARNVKATGQIILSKRGLEFNNTLLNGNYSFANHVFEVRENNQSGKVVGSMTTDTMGVAKINVPLGTYYISEKTAGIGFANTFKPVTVKVEYKDQKTPVVTVNTDGTNQEVTGSSVLTKEDEETGSETQGRATFKGAEYALFYSNGTPVKWTDKVKPTLTNGTKVKTDDDSIKIRIDDQNQKAGVGHLALADGYYWQETKAPEGYQIDKQKHNFDLKYKDQNTKVVVSNVTSKEKAIKFNFDFFKYLESLSGGSTTGVNGLEFELAPIAPTKGEVRKTVTQTDLNGYDGYGSFLEVPYGDYWFREVNAPEGYKPIIPLKIESNFNEKTREYVLTITEKGQKEPIKTMTIPESKINDGSNVITFSKMFFTNRTVKIPEIITEASVDGKQTFRRGPETPMHDNISISDMYKNGNYRLKDLTLWRIQNEDYDNAVAVYQTNEDFVAKKENMDKKADTIVDTSKDDENTKYVWTSKLAEVDPEDSTKEKIVAEHFDLTNEDQTVRPEAEPEIKTLFATAEGGKLIDARFDQELPDMVSQDFPESQIGKTKYWVQQMLKVDAEGNDTVLQTIHEKRKVKSTHEEFEVIFSYKAAEHQLKEGEKLVATHVVYDDVNLIEEYARHFDLDNEDQTIRPEAEPEIKTLFATAEGGKLIDGRRDHKLPDTVGQKFPESQIGKTKYWVQELRKVDTEGKDTVLQTINEAREVKSTEEEFEVVFSYEAEKHQLKEGEKLVVTHIVYNDEKHEQEYARHFDLDNEDQTIRPEAEPEIKTLFATSEGGKLIDARRDHELPDTVSQKFPESQIGKTKYWVQELRKVDVEGKDSVLQTINEAREVKSTEEEFQVMFSYKAAEHQLKEGEKLVVTHVVYDDEEHEQEYAKHFDLDNEDQTIRPEEEPEIKTLFTTVEGGKLIDARRDQELPDTVSQKFPESQIGKTKYWVQELRKVDAEGKDTVLQTINEAREVKSTEEEFEVVFSYKAAEHQLKEGEKLVVTHVVYDDEEHEQDYAKHFDLDNEDQTIRPEAEPEIETLFTTKDGSQEIDSTKDQELPDKVSQTFPESQVGKTKYWVQELHKVDAEGKDTVLQTINEAREVKSAKEEFEVVFSYKAKEHELKEGEKLVVTHKVYDDENHEQEYASHFDLDNEKQTITPKKLEEKPAPVAKTIPQTGSYSALQNFFSSIIK